MRLFPTFKRRYRAPGKQAPRRGEATLLLLPEAQRLYDFDCGIQLAVSTEGWNGRQVLGLREARMLGRLDPPARLKPLSTTLEILGPHDVRETIAFDHVWQITRRFDFAAESVTYAAEEGLSCSISFAELPGETRLRLEHLRALAKDAWYPPAANQDDPKPPVNGP
jgi:hypothetical protein